MGVGGGAEIAAAVVEGVVIYVVNEEVGRGVEDFAVHLDCFRRVNLFDGDPSAGVEVAITRDYVPVEVDEPEVIGGVNDGEFAFSEGDDANVPAEANGMINTQGEKNKIFEPVG